jgi:hypothetical protein
MEEGIKTPQEVLEFISEHAKEAKYAWCEDSGGMADAPPILMGQFPNGSAFMMPDLLEGHPTDTLPQLLSALIEAMEEHNGSTEYSWLAYVVEGYYRPDTNEMPVGWQRGDLEQEYKDNPVSDVREGIVCTVYPWDGECQALTIPVSVGDNGLPVFGDFVNEGGIGGGTIPLIFEGFRKFCGIRLSAQNN